MLEASPSFTVSHRTKSFRTPQTFENAIRRVLPNVEIDEIDGEIVLYTGLQFTEDDQVVPVCDDSELTSGYDLPENDVAAYCRDAK